MKTLVILLIILGGITVGSVFASHNPTNPFQGFVTIINDITPPVLEEAYLTITRSGEYFAINTDSGTPVLELRDGDPTVDGGTPYINFVNDGTSMTDARIILLGDDKLAIQGADLYLDKLNPKIIPNGNICIGSGC